MARRRWGGEFKQAISDSVLARGGYIRPDRILHLWKSTSVSGIVPLQLWYLYVLEHWMRLEQSHRLEASALALQ